jgi:glycosyltransferase involved in cell wall biosynthesis
MRVLYVGNFDPYETGGTRRAYEVVRRIHRYDVEPYILHIKKVPDDALTSIGAIRSLKEVVVVTKSIERVKELNVDLVVSTSESPSSVIIAYHIARKLHKPWTAVMQLPIILRYTPASTEPVIVDLLWLPQQIYVLNLLRKTTILAVSASCILETTIKVPRFIVLRPGVGIEIENFSSIDDQEKLYDAIFMARLTPEKGVYDVVKIWSLVVKQRPEAKLAIAGKFKNDKVMWGFYGLVRKYRLKKNISYLGFLQEKEKVMALKRAKLFIYPSKLDAFPIAILEALASGLPVIAYDIPAIRYNYPRNLVFEVKKGYINLFAGKIIEFLRRVDAINIVGYKAKSFASYFTWEKVAEVEANAYKWLMNYFNEKFKAKVIKS